MGAMLEHLTVLFQVRVQVRGIWWDPQLEDILNLLSPTPAFHL